MYFVHQSKWDRCRKIPDVEESHSPRDCHILRNLRWGEWEPTCASHLLLRGTRDITKGNPCSAFPWASVQEVGGTDHLWEKCEVPVQTKKGNSTTSRIHLPLQASQVALNKLDVQQPHQGRFDFPLLKCSVKHWLCWASELRQTGFHLSADVFVKLQRNIDIKQPQEIFNTSFEKWQIYINYLRCWEKNYHKFPLTSNHFTVSLEFLPKKRLRTKLCVRKYLIHSLREADQSRFILHSFSICQQFIYLSFLYFDH